MIEIHQAENGWIVRTRNRNDPMMAMVSDSGVYVYRTTEELAEGIKTILDKQLKPQAVQAD